MDRTTHMSDAERAARYRWRKREGITNLPSFDVHANHVQMLADSGRIQPDAMRGKGSLKSAIERLIAEIAESPWSVTP